MALMSQNEDETTPSNPDIAKKLDIVFLNTLTNHMPIHEGGARSLNKGLNSGDMVNIF